MSDDTLFKVITGQHLSNQSLEAKVTEILTRPSNDAEPLRALMRQLRSPANGPLQVRAASSSLLEEDRQ
jgi:hypothetical protein